MRQWLLIGWIIVIAAAVFLVYSFIRTKNTEQIQQTEYKGRLAESRSALAPGSSRQHVEDYLRQKGIPFERVCCKADDFSDRARIGHEPRNWICGDWNVYLEFRFESGTTGLRAATGTDRLKQIDLYQNGPCL
jgi:hypothetical protein